MKNLANAVVKELATKLINRYNPYLKEATKCQTLDGKEYYLWHDGILYTKEQLDNCYRETAEKDIIHGYEERMTGYYDKWYRYNRCDEGAAYDEGVKYATKDSNCSDYMHIIPCLN